MYGRVWHEIYRPCNPERAAPWVMNKFPCSCRVSRKKAKTSPARGYRSRAFRFHFFIPGSNVKKRSPCFSSRSSRSCRKTQECIILLSRSSRILFAVYRLLPFPFILLSIPSWPPTTSFPVRRSFRTRGKHEAATRERKHEKDDSNWLNRLWCMHLLVSSITAASVVACGINFVDLIW